MRCQKPKNSGCGASNFLAVNSTHSTWHDHLANTCHILYQETETESKKKVPLSQHSQIQDQWQDYLLQMVHLLILPGRSENDFHGWIPANGWSYLDPTTVGMIHDSADCLRIYLPAPYMLPISCKIGRQSITAICIIGMKTKD